MWPPWEILIKGFRELLVHLQWDLRLNELARDRGRHDQASCSRCAWIGHNPSSDSARWFEDTLIA